MGSIVVRGEGFFSETTFSSFHGRPTRRRSRNRKRGRRETYRVEVAVVALLGQELDNQLDVTDLRGVVQRAAFRGGGEGAGQRGARRAISDEFRAAGAFHATAVEKRRPRGNRSVAGVSGSARTHKAPTSSSSSLPNIV